MKSNGKAKTGSSEIKYDRIKSDKSIETVALNLGAISPRELMAAVFKAITKENKNAGKILRNLDEELSYHLYMKGSAKMGLTKPSTMTDQTLTEWVKLACVEDKEAGVIIKMANPSQAQRAEKTVRSTLVFVRGY